MGISIAALEIRWCEVTLERIGSHPVDILDMKDEVYSSSRHCTCGSGGTEQI